MGNSLRRKESLKQFTELLVSVSGKRQTAESAVTFLKQWFNLADCLLVLPASEFSRTRSYGDRAHYLPADLVPRVGETMQLPTAMQEQGWQSETLQTVDETVGWLLYRSKRGKPKRIDLNGCSSALALALQVQIARHNLVVARKSFEEQLDQTTKQLTRSNNKLIALDETKDEFITMASHQLRTPLTSIKGYVSMVLEGDAGKLNEQQKKLLNQAFISSQRMVYLIADLLNVSRLRTGRFVIEPKSTYLPDIIDGELDQLAETAKAKGLVLSFIKPKDFPTLELDETKIRQVIMNFIDNAIHYTQAGGEIKVELEEHPRSVELRVVDNGIGVPKTEQHKLFNRFFRADNARRARPDGTGLGLFMAKKVIIAQGGAIIFRSTEGKGSTFGFIFPLTGKNPSK